MILMIANDKSNRILIVPNAVHVKLSTSYILEKKTNFYFSVQFGKLQILFKFIKKKNTRTETDQTLQIYFGGEQTSALKLYTFFKTIEMK